MAQIPMSRQTSGDHILVFLVSGFLFWFWDKCLLFATTEKDQSHMSGIGEQRVEAALTLHWRCIDAGTEPYPRFGGTTIVESWGQVGFSTMWHLIIGLNAGWVENVLLWSFERRKQVRNCLQSALVMTDYMIVRLANYEYRIPGYKLLLLTHIQQQWQHLQQTMFHVGNKWMLHLL